MIKNKTEETINFVKELHLFGKKIKLKFESSYKNVLSLWLEYEDYIIYSTLVLNEKNENKNTNFTVYYKEQNYTHSKYANNRGGKTDKEILLSRTIDRSLRPFLRHIVNRDISLTVLLLDGKKNDHQLIRVLLWSGALLVHYACDNILHYLYTGTVKLDNGSCIASVNDHGLVMLEGAFHPTPIDKMSLDAIFEEQKIFKDIFHSIPSTGLLKVPGDQLAPLETKKQHIKHIRSNGRKYEEIRPLNIILRPLKGANSVIFKRGETSVLGVLSIAQSEVPDVSVSYRFNPFSVGECGETFGNSRREKGHGDFVKNSLKSFWKPGFSYKMTGEVFSCSGSSSQATLCATSLCLANEFGDSLVSGITVGKINNRMLVDLSAEEDGLSDCDLKVVSNEKSEILGLFMDTKNTITLKDFYKMVELAQRANGKIIKYMTSHLVGHRELIRVKTSKLGSVVGKNGHNMKEIQRILNCHMKVFENGFVLLHGEEKKSFNVAKEIIESFNRVEDGEVITAIIYSIRDVDLDMINVNLGIFNFNIAKKFFDKYDVGNIIVGKIHIQEKNITLDNIKKHNFLKRKSIQETDPK